MLINELLGELDLDFKLGDRFIALHKKVLREEEWNFSSVRGNVKSRDLLILGPRNSFAHLNRLF